MSQNGQAFVSENFAGQLVMIDKKGNPTVIASAPGLEISAPSVSGSTVYYAQTTMDHSSSWLYSLSNGVSTPVADIAGHEAMTNPDTVNTYGFVDLDPACAAQFMPFPPEPSLGVASYTGAIDTHPYASLAVGGAVYIADAGGNAILRVEGNGNVSTVAVLPPSAPIVVGADQAMAVNWPACVVGQSYRTEPVPTDVEMGPDGWLYVTSLPGGPEDPSLGARGSVYKVDPATGETVLVASGFAGATGLAVSGNGNIYVAELFGGADGSGQVSLVRPGASTPSVLLALPMPSAISVRAEKLYISTNSLAPDAAQITVVPLKGTGSSK